MVKAADTKKSRPAASYTVAEIRAMTPGERIDLCELFTLEAYGWTEETRPRLRRDVVKVIRIR
jgi:hypothetical protein